ncbi:hypothetical protein [Peristeroidobacter soli]|jgi:hypothetical protein|uniref:hypothetical protein n=1 Tax=Peristeroidobacter soli TaxID=2497877 RepID=UPI00101CB336|nr:hypothetical protein [Peristeroidobacter soli]
MKIGYSLVAMAGLFVTLSAHAGHSTGTVGQLVVGRMDTQVFIELQSDTYTSWPCASTHPSGFRYAFLLGTEKAKAMLSVVLTAQATGQHLQVVGTGSCTIDSTMENVDYVVLRP